MATCATCKNPGANYANPCCSAPDCPERTAYRLKAEMAYYDRMGEGYSE